MKNKSIFFFLFFAIPLFAGETMTPMFNGEDLTGWVNVNCAPETWTVEDGMIKCTGLPIGVLRTEKMYENFIMELDYKHMQEKGNAGVFIHSAPLPVTGKPFTKSHEIQILDGRYTENYTSDGDIFSIQGAFMVPNPIHPNGWMRSLPQERRANPVGEWNHYRIESRDGTVTLAVNGKVVTRAYDLNPRKGYICLEAEGSLIYFRDVKIMELPGTNPPQDVIAESDNGFVSLFTGLDLRGWKQVPGNKDHWIVKDGVIVYDGKSKAEGEDKHLWTEKSYGNFILMVDWRQPMEPFVDNVPVILPDGSTLKDEKGKEITIPVKDAGDSGIYIRGHSKNQINIWNWPVGSGEIWGYRTDQSIPPHIRRDATPIVNADNPIGKWNRFVITVIDETVSVELNGVTVIRNAHLPGMAKTGPIALQHHGDPIEFTNIYIKELN